MNPDRRAFLVTHLVDTIGRSQAEAAEVIRVFDSEAARVVRSTPFSSSGMYPSFKNRAAIMRESRTGELPYIRLLEHDDDVLAYAHQPAIPVRVRWMTPDGQPRHASLTADFIVIRQDRVALVEVKPEDQLVALANDRPGYLVRDPDTRRWRCESASDYLAPLGLEYEIVTTALYPATRIRNLANLGAAFRAALPDPATVSALLERVRVEPGVSIAALAVGGVTEGAIHVLVAASLVYVDLDRDDLTLARAVPVYPNRTVAAALATRHTPSFAIGTATRPPLVLRTGAKLWWLDAPVEVIAAGPSEVLIRQIGAAPDAMTTVPRSELDAAWAGGTLEAEEPAVGDSGHAVVRIARRRYEGTGQIGLDAAMRRHDLVAAWKATGRVPAAASLRSLRRWDGDRRRLEALTGDPFVGLCPAPRSGNTAAKIDTRVVTIIEAVLAEIFLVPNGVPTTMAVAEVARRCGEAGLAPPHGRTVRRRINAIPRERVVAARAGRKAAYNLTQFAPIDPDTTAPNGDFAFAVAHIDGTLLDLETVHPETGLPLGRAWMHRMIDGHSGLELARYIAYTTPSEAVVLELLWRCAVRWGVLPLGLVVDLGSEHRGQALDACCLATGVELDWRPKSRPRHGAPIEGSFRTLDTDLVFQLAGNTQSRRHIRQETAEINPTNHAIHSIAWLDRLLDEYNEIIGARIAARLGQARMDSLQSSLAARAGSTIPYVAADDRLRFLTMAPVDGVTRKIHATKGFRVNQHDYHDAAFRLPPLEGSKRRVRYALGDPTYVLVEVAGTYLRVANRDLVRARVTSPDEIGHLSAVRRRTASVSARANQKVTLRLAGLGARARSRATEERERLGETRLQQSERSRAQENAATQAGHSAAGSWGDRPPLLPTLPPEAQDEADDDDPYGYAWAEPTDPDLQPNRVHPPTHRPKERA